jgi:hypothetical protein
MKCFGCFLKVWKCGGEGERGGWGKLGGAGVWVFITNYHSEVLCFFFLFSHDELLCFLISSS